MSGCNLACGSACPSTWDRRAKLTKPVARALPAAELCFPFSRPTVGRRKVTPGCRPYILSSPVANSILLVEGVSCPADPR